jgi:hypothetical protein
VKNMKNSRYKEVLDLAWSVDAFVLIGKKGTCIYKEERDNHIPGMKRCTSEGEFPLPRYDYLVFEVQGKVDSKILKGIAYEHGVVLTQTNYGTEIACHHPQVFHNSLLSNLEQLGYIKRTWKQQSKEKGEYPFYVNPNASQLIFNIGSLTLEGLHKGMLYLSKKGKKVEGETNEN